MAFENKMPVDPSELQPHHPEPHTGRRASYFPIVIDVNTPWSRRSPRPGRGGARGTHTGPRATIDGPAIRSTAGRSRWRRLLRDDLAPDPVAGRSSAPLLLYKLVLGLMRSISTVVLASPSKGAARQRVASEPGRSPSRQRIPRCGVREQAAGGCCQVFDGRCLRLDGQRPPTAERCTFAWAALDYITKPFSVSRLEHVIEVALAYRGREA